MRIIGAREHNLQAIEVELDLGQITAFVGRSGSGKSSLAFDTLHGEGQRRYLEALSTRVRPSGSLMPRPKVDVLEGLPPTIALAQQRAEGSARTTIGSHTEITQTFRTLFGRLGTQICPISGEELSPQSHDQIVSKLRSLAEGARLFIEVPIEVGEQAKGVLDEVRIAGFSRVRVDGTVQRLDEVAPGALSGDSQVRIVIDRIKLRADRIERLHDALRTASRSSFGVIVVVADGQELVFTDRPYSFGAKRAYPPLEPALFRAPGPHCCHVCEGTGRVESEACHVCGETGLGELARAVRWEGLTLPEILGMPMETLLEVSEAWSLDAVSTPLITGLRHRLQGLCEVGLGALSLGRRCDQLSSGEYQRVRLSKQVGSALAGVLYLLDEPAGGLDGEQVEGIVGAMKGLRGKGNGVVVVAHHPQIIAAADRVIEFGPGPGKAGGRLIFDGAPEDLLRADTPTGRWLSGREHLEAPEPVPERPLGHYEGLTWTWGGVTTLRGVSGSGKSRRLAGLVARLKAQLEGSEEALDGADHLQRLVVAEAGAARRSRRSTPATYSGMWEVMRPLLAATREAQVRGMEASTFSLNVKGGRCESCKGLGVRRIELGALPPVDVVCEVCHGRRFASDVLEVRWRGLNAGEILDLTVDEAHGILAGHPRLEEILRTLKKVGLGYVQLGQPVHTLSGGEAQRLKLGRELIRAIRRGGDDLMIILDSPTRGLHPADVSVLNDLFHSLSREGATVVLASHHPGLAEASHHVVTLDPTLSGLGQVRV